MRAHSIRMLPLCGAVFVIPAFPGRLKIQQSKLYYKKLAALKGGGCLPYLRAVCYFYCDFPRFNPQVHHYPMKLLAGEYDDGRVWERLRMGLPSTSGSK